MNLSVIIPTLNEAAGVGRCIDSAWACGASEVIVVDGGSTDETTSIARGRRANVLQAARGRAQQQNAGAKSACGDLYLFLHADNWLDVACGPQISAAAAAPEFRVGAFRQRIDAPERKFRLLERGNAARVRWLRMAYGDQGILLRRHVFYAAGGFPDVRLMEDLLMMMRIRKLARPLLLPGPLYVSSRRWRRYGVIRQTLRNWTLVTARRLGVSPNRLADFYPPHEGGAH